MNLDKELSKLYPWILYMAKRYCKHQQDAEDLANDTIYKILVNRSRFDCNKSLRAWCFIVLRNTYITMYNRYYTLSFVGYDVVMENSSTSSASDSVLFRDVVSAIRRCYQKSCCMDCVIFFAKGFSYDEISEILNIPVNTVRSRISYGRKQLYQELNS